MKPFSLMREWCRKAQTARKGPLTLRSLSDPRVYFLLIFHQLKLFQPMSRTLPLTSNHPALCQLSACYLTFSTGFVIAVGSLGCREYTCFISVA